MNTPHSSDKSTTPLDRIKRGIRSIRCWQQGTYYYEKIQLSEVIQELEHRFQVKIVCHPLGILDHVFSGYLYHEYLDGALMSICYSLGMKYEHRGAQVVLSRA